MKTEKLKEFNNDLNGFPKNKLEKITAGLSFCFLTGGLILGGLMTYKTKEEYSFALYGLTGMSAAIISFSVSAISYLFRLSKK